MPYKVRFIHAADIHLGSILNTGGKPPNSIAQILKEAVYTAFDRICEAAVRFDVDFVILSGDVFDNEVSTVKAHQRFKKGCEKLQTHNIPVFVIAGNHDPLESELETGMFKLPENVYFFDSEKVEIKEVRNVDNELIARILGQSYRGRSESRKMYSSFTPPDTGITNIGLLHTQLDPYNNNYVPCAKSDLLLKNDIHYWALGHIHQCRIINKGVPFIAYSGTPQGKDFGEEEIGGCLLVEMNGDTVNQIYFIPTASLIWQRIEIPIDVDTNNTPRNLEDLKDLIIDRAEEMLNRSIAFPEEHNLPQGFSFNFFEGYIVQWILTGRSELHHILSDEDEGASQFLMEELQNHFKNRKPFLWTDSVIIRTGKPLPDLDDFKKHSPIAAEVEELIKLALKGDEFREDLKKKLGKIWEIRVDPEDVDERKFQLDDRTYKGIIDQAEKLIIEKLVERRETI